MRVNIYIIVLLRESIKHSYTILISQFILLLSGDMHKNVLHTGYFLVSYEAHDIVERKRLGGSKFQNFKKNGCKFNRPTTSQVG